MKTILIVYGTMSIGGSTTSLLSLLQYFDRSKYEVDFALVNSNGELQGLIPKDLNILSDLMPADIHLLKKKSFRAIVTYFKAFLNSKRSTDAQNVMGQIMSYENVRLSPKLEKIYDVAISFLENYPLVYVANNVKAKKKISWIHVDYGTAGFIPKFDRKCFSNFDKFVFVSEECKKSFDVIFPEYSDKTIVIENILVAKTIAKLSEETIDFSVSKNFINIVTVCRISFASKGLDRGVLAFHLLQKENIKHNIRWYIIGNGPDYKQLSSMIKELGLEEVIVLLGAKSRPLPYVKIMDVFFLPSRHEGKPMAVTEAQMLGVPPVVTNYASASGQIKSGFDGLIVENTDVAIYEALCYLIKNPDDVKKWRRNLQEENFDNIQEVDKVCRLIEEK